MAWTAPRTWVSTEIITASIMNTHVRDNLLETAPAKATAAGLVLATAANSIVVRPPSSASVTALETTASTGYTNIGTDGPAVSIPTGSDVFIAISARVSSTTAGALPSFAYAIAGATAISADVTRSYQAEISNSNDVYMGTFAITQGTLTPGTNTFQMKYAELNGVGTATFATRRISVIPMN